MGNPSANKANEIEGHEISDTKIKPSYDDTLPSRSFNSYSLQIRKENVPEEHREHHNRPVSQLQASNLRSQDHVHQHDNDFDNEDKIKRVENEDNHQNAFRQYRLSIDHNIETNNGKRHINSDMESSKASITIPNKIIKDGKVFYRHDANKRVQEKASGLTNEDDVDKSGKNNLESLSHNANTLTFSTAQGSSGSNGSFHAEAESQSRIGGTHTVVDGGMHGASASASANNVMGHQALAHAQVTPSKRIGMGSKDASLNSAPPPSISTSNLENIMRRNGITGLAVATVTARKNDRINSPYSNLGEVLPGFNAESLVHNYQTHDDAQEYYSPNNNAVDEVTPPFNYYNAKIDDGGLTVGAGDTHRESEVEQINDVALPEGNLNIPENEGSVGLATYNQGSAGYPSLLDSEAFDSLYLDYNVIDENTLPYSYDLGSVDRAHAYDAVPSNLDTGIQYPIIEGDAPPGETHFNNHMIIDDTLPSYFAEFSSAHGREDHIEGSGSENSPIFITNLQSGHELQNNNVENTIDAISSHVYEDRYVLSQSSELPDVIRNSQSGLIEQNEELTSVPNFNSNYNNDMSDELFNNVAYLPNTGSISVDNGGVVNTDIVSNRGMIPHLAESDGSLDQNVEATLDAESQPAYTSRSEFERSQQNQGVYSQTSKPDKNDDDIWSTESQPILDIQDGMSHGSFDIGRNVQGDYEHENYDFHVYDTTSQSTQTQHSEVYSYSYPYSTDKETADAATSTSIVNQAERSVFDDNIMNKHHQISPNIRVNQANRVNVSDRFPIRSTHQTSAVQPPQRHPTQNSRSVGSSMKVIKPGEIGSVQYLSPSDSNLSEIKVVMMKAPSAQELRSRKGRTYQPGETLPGTGGYKVPQGFRGRLIISTAKGPAIDSFDRTHHMAMNMANEMHGQVMPSLMTNGGSVTSSTVPFNSRYGGNNQWQQGSHYPQPVHGGTAPSSHSGHGGHHRQFGHNGNYPTSHSRHNGYYQSSQSGWNRQHGQVGQPDDISDSRQNSHHLPPQAGKNNHYGQNGHSIPQESGQNGHYPPPQSGQDGHYSSSQSAMNDCGYWDMNCNNVHTFGDQREICLPAFIVLTCCC